MSLADRTLPERTTLPADGIERADLSRTARRLLSGPLSMVAFWGAIALPALYLPFLFAGIETTRGLVLFLALIGLHLVALGVGRGYRSAAD